MWNVIIPFLTLLIGLVGGFFLSNFYLRKEFTKMQSDPKQIQAMAKSMGMNLNQKQLNMVSRQMQNGSKKKNKK